MNKADLIEKISSKVGVAKKEVEDVVNCFIETTTQELKSGGEIVLTGFGSFMTKRRESRVGVNPQNPGQKINIPAVTVPKFKAGKALKDALK